MWLSTSAANDWQFNPVKWDWSSAKTWVALGQGVVAGYKMGSSAESFLKEKALKIKMNRFINDDSFNTSADGTLEKSDATLNNFSKKYFRNVRYRERVILEYDNSIAADNPNIGAKLDWDISTFRKGSPYIKFIVVAFSDKVTLFRCMGHEYVHATNYFLGLKNSPLTEYAAYSWEYLILKDKYPMLAAERLSIATSKKYLNWYNRFFNNQYQYRSWELVPNLGLPLELPNF